MGNPAHVDDTGHLIVGSSLRRQEDDALLRGTALFGADLTAAELDLSAPIAFAAFTRSPFARAEVRSVDCSRAREAPGVLGAFTASDLGVVPVGPLAAALPAIFTQPLLGDGHVRFVGEAVALVVATSEAEAVDAAELVDVDYEPLPPVMSADQALAGSELLFDETSRAEVRGSLGEVRGNIIVEVEHSMSPASDGGLFDDCDVTVTACIDVPRQSPAPIEPRTMTAWWDDGELHVWSATQRPHGFRDQLATLFDLRPELVHVAAGPMVGGGFGGKTSRGAEEHAIPAAARLLERPIRWVETRSEYMAAATQGRDERFDITIGGTTNGQLVAIDVRMVKDNGAYPTSCAYLPGAFTKPNLSGCYRFERIGFSSTSVVTNKAPISAFRGAGRAAYIVALEQMVDRFAQRIGMDPADVRRRNLISADAMPFTTVVGSVYDPADYQADLETALTLADYERLRMAQTAHDHSSMATGIGIACYNHMTVGGGGEEAIVSVTDDGGAVVRTGTSDQGHGHRTTWAQIAADALGIPVEKIEVSEGSTAYTDDGVGAVGSRSLQTAGVALHKACDAVIERAKVLAAQCLEAADVDIVFEAAAGAFFVRGTPSRTIDWVTVAGESRAGGAELTCGEVHDVGDNNSFPSGCHVAVVTVDLETGRVELNRYVAVDDAGRRVNPMIVDGQLHGGIAAGVGQVLGEEIIYADDGNLLTGNFGTYQVITADQLPSFELSPSETPSTFNRYGCKGVGESGTVGATPAVYNAVLDALRPYGVTEVELPCTPERVWSALRQAASSR